VGGWEGKIKRNNEKQDNDTFRIDRDIVRCFLLDKKGTIKTKNLFR
jgi:hypothetical protein